MTETSKGPAITSANLPRPAVPSSPKATVGAGLPQAVRGVAAATVASALDSIVAAPLNSPDFVHLIPANPDVTFRWVLHTLYKQDGSQNNIRFEKAKVEGYAIATQADIKNPPMEYARDGGTKFINGDLILMKIDRRKYEGALLYKDQKAAKQMLAATGKSALRELNREAQGSSLATRGKIAAFDPTQDSELAKFIGAAEDEGAAPLGGQ